MLTADKKNIINRAKIYSGSQICVALWTDIELLCSHVKLLYKTRNLFEIVDAPDICPEIVWSFFGSSLHTIICLQFAVRPQYNTHRCSDILTQRLWKSVRRNSLLYISWIYRHPLYSATVCGERTLTQYLSFTVVSKMA